MKTSQVHTAMQPALSSNRPRVLFLIDRMHATTGGAEGAVHRLCQFLPERGFRCSVATFWAGEGLQQCFSCPVHVLPLSRIYDWNAFQQALVFRRLLHSERVDIVHTFFPASDLWGGLVAKLSGCPVLVSSRRDMGILRARKHALPYRLANLLFDQVQAVSDKVREFSIGEDHLPANKVVTVYNGTDLEAIDAATACDPACLPGSEGPVIATVANIRSIKGIDILVQSASLVLRQVPQARFLIIGAELQEPDYVKGVRTAIHNLGIQDRVHFMGRRTDVCSVLKSCNVFCLPSRSEGMSNALLEAMACSLPCVATNVGGNSEVIVEGQTGFLVPSEDPNALANQLVVLLGDLALAHRMGKAGRRIVEARFTVRHMVNRLADLYEALLTRKSISIDGSGAPIGDPNVRQQAIPANLESRL